MESRPSVGGPGLTPGRLREPGAGPQRTSQRRAAGRARALGEGPSQGRGGAQWGEEPGRRRCPEVWHIVGVTGSGAERSRGGWSRCGAEQAAGSGQQGAGQAGAGAARGGDFWHFLGPAGVGLANLQAGNPRVPATGFLVVCAAMAKWGQGDPRWIVEEREDGTNVNNWHWCGRRAGGWASGAGGLRGGPRGPAARLPLAGDGS